MAALPLLLLCCCCTLAALVVIVSELLHKPATLLDSGAYLPAACCAGTGCDGSEPQRKYYDKLARLMPLNTMVSSMSVCCRVGLGVCVCDTDSVYARV
jgi:hypothetical protein